jgi:hypothetical protein
MAAVKDLSFEAGARKALLAGVEKLAAAVKATLGPRGRGDDRAQHLRQARCGQAGRRGIYGDRLGQVGGVAGDRWIRQKEEDRGRN